MDLMTVMEGGGDTETGILHGREIRAFVQAIPGQDTNRIIQARMQLVKQTSELFTADVAGISAHFHGINRIASGTGIQINPSFPVSQEIQEYTDRTFDPKRV